ncbi:MAG: hypothetical protein DA328_08520 [Nitrososphaeraceae archaeon]|nr:hypothetical protein [Nitrososphaeraceae archaeon]
MNRNTVIVGLIFSGIFLSIVPMQFIYAQNLITEKLDTIKNATEDAVGIIENTTKSAITAGATIAKNATEDAVGIIENTTKSAITTGTELVANATEATTEATESAITTGTELVANATEATTEATERIGSQCYRSHYRSH